MIIEVKDVGQIGVVTDRPPNELPLNAWTSARNIRFREGVAEKFSGHIQVFGEGRYYPKWLLHTAQSGTPFWLYASDTNVGATDGTNHANITRVAGPYTANMTIGWTGTIIEGIPVITNGADIPQMWVTPSLAQPLQDLTAWPSTLRCNTLTGLKRYLVALDCFKSGTRFPTMIKWSHQAPTGGVPTSWDETDDTKDAGEYTLPGDDFLVDGKEMRDILILYREASTWQMQYVGGIDIFRFTKLFDHIGCLSRRCAVEFFSGKHLVFTGDDVVVHDGHQAESVLAERARRLISGKVDGTYYTNSFVVADHANNEVWVCFPETGSKYATIALVWNRLLGTWGVRELPGVAHMADGIVSQGAVSEAWDDAVGTWDSDNIAWGDRVSDPTQRKLLMAVPDEVNSTRRFYIPGLGNNFAGTDMTVTLERLGLGFPVKNGDPPDYSRYKQILGLFPRINGTQGGVLNIYMGTQEKIGKTVNWSQARAYTIGETDFLDFSDLEASRIHTLRIESVTAIDWRLQGYDVDVIDRGAH